MSFKPNTEQLKAFDAVSRAIKKAKKLGLVFYGKSDCLVAYTKQADDYIEDNGFENMFGNGTGQIPCISKMGLINDSGADDYPSFLTQEDEYKFSDDY